MNSMNLLPPDLRPRSARRAHAPPALRWLVLAALLVGMVCAYFTVEVIRLEARVQEGCAQIDMLTAASAPAAGAMVPDRSPPLIKGVVEGLDACVPPDVALTGLKVYGAAETPTTNGGPPVPVPRPEQIEITGVAGSGSAVGYLLTALEHSGPCAGVTLGSMVRQEDGEFAFTVLGRLSP